MAYQIIGRSTEDKATPTMVTKHCPLISSAYYFPQYEQEFLQWHYCLENSIFNDFINIFCPLTLFYEILMILTYTYIIWLIIIKKYIFGTIKHLILFHQYLLSHKSLRALNVDNAYKMSQPLVVLISLILYPKFIKSYATVLTGRNRIRIVKIHPSQANVQM